MTQAPSSSPSPRDVRLVLLIAGVVGGGVGGVGATWQWAVEIGQMHAGIVQYAPDTLAAGVHAHVWSGLHQVVALALTAGVSEAACSFLLSVAITALALQGLTLAVLAFAPDVRYAMTMALAIVWASAYAYGLTYPIEVLPTANTHGSMAFWLGVLTAALAGCGWFGSSAFLAGTLLAVHPVTAVWVTAGLALAGWVSGALAGRWRAILSGYVAGLALSAVSFVAHWAMRPPIAALQQDPSQYVRGLIQYWDLHRHPVRWSAASVWFNVATIALSATCWRRASMSQRLLLAFAAAIGCAALLMAGATALPVERLPVLFVLSIPGRFLNFDSALLAPLLLGLVGEGRLIRVPAFVPIAVVWTLVVSDRTPIRPWNSQYGGLALVPQPWLLLATSAIALFTAALLGRPMPWQRPERLRSIARRVALPVAALAAFGFVRLATSDATSKERLERLWRRSADDAVFEAAARGSGTLVTARELWLVQLRTRRPVLLDCVTIDTIVYAPEAAPFAERVLRDVYGLSLLARPSESREGPFDRLAERAAWARLTIADWRRIRREYGATEVLSHRDWPLNLPVVAAGSTLLLSRIPD